jgi:hypothetical protein
MRLSWPEEKPGGLEAGAAGPSKSYLSFKVPKGHKEQEAEVTWEQMHSALHGGPSQ